MLRRAFLSLLAAGLGAGADADLILHNGKIVTVDAKFSIRQAVAELGIRVALRAVIDSDRPPRHDSRKLAAAVLEAWGQSAPGPTQ